MDKQRYSFDDLLAIMDRLRGPDGCPWDKQQTSRTLRTYFLEEVYEALDAIDRDDPDDLCEELGDSLFEIVFLAKVNQQQGRFDMHQVVDGIARKMIRRHPHIFNDTGERAETATEVEGIWARTKVSEKSSMSDPAGRAAPAPGPVARLSAERARGQGRVRLARPSGRAQQADRGGGRADRGPTTGRQERNRG